MRPLALLALLGLALSTTACVPLAVVIAGYAAEGAMVATTSKSSTDHLMSMATRRDCAALRSLGGDAPCRDWADGQNPYELDAKAPFHTRSESGEEALVPTDTGATLLVGAAAAGAVADHVELRLKAQRDARAAVERGDGAAAAAPGGDGSPSVDLTPPAPRAARARPAEVAFGNDVFMRRRGRPDTATAAVPPALEAAPAPAEPAPAVPE